MPNVRSMDVTKDGLTIVASDGRTFSVTRTEIIDFFRAQSGNRNARRNATITWVKTNMEAALGAEQVPAALMTFDFDDQDALRQLRVELGVL